MTDPIFIICVVVAFLLILLAPFYFRARTELETTVRSSPPPRPYRSHTPRVEIMPGVAERLRYPPPVSDKD